MVNPHRIVVPLGVDDASIYRSIKYFDFFFNDRVKTKFRWPMPKYIAKVTVLEAHDLINADGVSDKKSRSKITNL